MMILALSAQPFGMPQIVALCIALFALLISGFVSGSELAFFSLTDSQLEDMEDDDDPKSKSIVKLLQRPERLLATILIANNLVNVTIVVLTNFALGPVFSGMHPALSFILQSVILTFLILLFGEILPKLYSTGHPVQWARFSVGALSFIATLLSPLSRVLECSSIIVNKVVEKKASISTDELSEALDITDVKATDDKQMLEGILKFGDTTASEIMTPRVSIVGIDESATFDEVMDVVREKGFSRMPVYADTMDHIKGVLYSRDLLPYIGRCSSEFDWRSLLRKPYYVPESKQIDTLLEDFRKLKLHIAIVIDEFGGTQGVVTLEDVLEEIVGDISDEYDEDERFYTKISSDTFNFDGRTPLTDFFRITGLDPDEFEDVSEDSETLAGMLLTIKGDFPKEKEPLEYGRCRFLVLKVEGHRISEARVHIKALADTPQK